MFRSNLARMATVGAATATMLVASAYPAIAVQTDDVGTMANMSVAVDGGKMTFIDDGDIFEICDTWANGESVYGALFYNSYVSTDGWKRVMTTEDGGDAGCDRKGHNIGNGGEYIMVICGGKYPTGIIGDVYCDGSGSFNE
ncbi:hypothetical protein PUR57_13550 [Streptomyces sp. JV176]|uniref:hypothetical protein n=2 Tax=Streptomyces TaxID=1883 RepID=UPI002E75C941|nr:hypothetical protein [Streptomyces sp. JV176]MEE1799684.1 hypothetical protein [Streptomyces sp. JV176]